MCTSTSFDVHAHSMRVMSDAHFVRLMWMGLVSRRTMCAWRTCSPCVMCPHTFCRWHSRALYVLDVRTLLHARCARSHTLRLRYGHTFARDVQDGVGRARGLRPLDVHARSERLMCTYTILFPMITRQLCVFDVPAHALVCRHTLWTWCLRKPCTLRVHVHVARWKCMCNHCALDSRALCALDARNSFDALDVPLPCARLMCTRALGARGVRAQTLCYLCAAVLRAHPW